MSHRDQRAKVKQNDAPKGSLMTAEALSPLSFPWWNMPARWQAMRDLQKRLKILDARITHSIQKFESHSGSDFESELNRTGEFIAARRNIGGAEEF
jgi:hypothetical protein